MLQSASLQLVIAQPIIEEPSAELVEYGHILRSPSAELTLTRDEAGGEKMIGDRRLAWRESHA